MDETKCAKLERKLIEATVNYEFASKRGTGTKIKGDFYTVVFDDGAQTNLENMTKEYKTALADWAETCIEKRA